MERRTTTDDDDDERTNERTNERASERTNERTKQRQGPVPQNPFALPTCVVLLEPTANSGACECECAILLILANSQIISTTRNSQILTVASWRSRFVGGQTRATRCQFFFGHVVVVVVLFCFHASVLKTPATSTKVNYDDHCTSTYVDVRKCTSTYVVVRRRTSTYVVARRRTSTYVVARRRTSTHVNVHTPFAEF